MKLSKWSEHIIWCFIWKSQLLICFPSFIRVQPKSDFCRYLLVVLPCRFGTTGTTYYAGTTLKTDQFQGRSKYPPSKFMSPLSWTILPPLFFADCRMFPSLLVDCWMMSVPPDVSEYWCADPIVLFCFAFISNAKI